MEKQKATIDDVKKMITPYIKKPLLSKAYIEASDVSRVCQIIRNKYKNVEIAPRPGKDGYPYLKAYVKAWLLSAEVEYEIRVNGRRNRTHDPLGWIDRLEEWDAMR